MSENCVHKPDVNFSEFFKRYFKKDGVLMQTLRCKNCRSDIRLVKKPVYRLWDVLLWIVLLAFMLLARLMRDWAETYMAPWLYILIAVIAVCLLGLVLDITREWLLLRHGSFAQVIPEPSPEDGAEASKAEDAPEKDEAADK